MKRILLHAALCLPSLILASSLPLAATQVRGSSGNGTNPDVASWDLLARSRTIRVSSTTDGKQVAMRRQIVCLNEDVEDSLANPNPLLTGTCDSGVYIHVFQFESSAKEVTVTIGHIVADPDSAQDYGVMICDNSDRQSGNTLELCTNDPTKMHLPEIKISVAKTAVHFRVSNFPSYQEGVDNQGRGLTLYVITRQPSPFPIQLPTVEIH